MFKRIVTGLLLVLLVLLTIVMYKFFFVAPKQNAKAAVIKTQEQKINEEIAIENQRKLDEEILRAKIANSKNFVKSISNEIEIIVLKEDGEHTIKHDRTPQNKWYSEWINNAEITIKLDYRTIFSIKTKDIDFTVTPNGTVIVKYDSSQIVISAIDISNVIPDQTVSAFGSKYKPTEVAALEGIAKEEVRVLSYNEKNILKASTNLKLYITDMATKFGIEDISIIEITKDIYIDSEEIAS